MKTFLLDYASRRNVWSLFILGVFILLAAGSLQYTTNDLLPDGRIKETFADIAANKKREIIGKRDREGRWTGQVTIQYVSTYDSYTEETYMAYGMRQGISTRTYRDGYKVVQYYVNDVAVADGNKSGSLVSAGSAYQLLDGKYPWFLFEMNACNFDSAYVQAYMDTIEMLLFTTDFELRDFNYSYGDVLDSLMNTHFSDIIDVNSRISAAEGFQKMKNSELRLAVLDRYWSDASSSFPVIEAKYPGYLKAMNDSGIISSDFRIFCHKLDSCLDSYGALDETNAFFTDSIDDRLYRALYFIAWNEESSVLNLLPTLKSISVLALPPASVRVLEIFDEFKLKNQPQSTPAEISQLVINDILLRFYNKADIFQDVFHSQALLVKNAVTAPMVATVLEKESFETAVNVSGYVLSDGGAAVTSEGMVWATHYNPTIEDFKLASPEIAAVFKMKITGLVPGTTYYVRSYGVNEKGLSYGNCVEFAAGQSVWAANVEDADAGLTVFPNPVSNTATLKFSSFSPNYAIVQIFDLHGKQVVQKQIQVNQATCQISLDLSGLKEGLYTLTVIYGNEKLSQKITKIR